MAQLTVPEPALGVPEGGDGHARALPHVLGVRLAQAALLGADVQKEGAAVDERRQHEGKQEGDEQRREQPGQPQPVVYVQLVLQPAPQRLGPLHRRAVQRLGRHLATLSSQTIVLPASHTHQNWHYNHYVNKWICKCAQKFTAWPINLVAGPKFNKVHEQQNFTI